MTRRVDDEETWQLQINIDSTIGHFHHIFNIVSREIRGTDLLSDTAGLASLHICLSELVEDQRLTRIYVTEDANDWATQLCLLLLFSSRLDRIQSLLIPPFTLNLPLLFHLFGIVLHVTKCVRGILYIFGLLGLFRRATRWLFRLVASHRCLSDLVLGILRLSRLLSFLQFLRNVFNALLRQIVQILLVPIFDLV